MGYNEGIPTASPGDSDDSPASTAFVQQELGDYVQKSGDTMTGALLINAAELRVTDYFIKVIRAAASNHALRTHVNTDVDNRFVLDVDGHQEWGDGTNPPDTNLYRDSANSLTTDDALTVGLGLNVLAGDLDVQAGSVHAGNAEIATSTVYGSTYAQFGHSTMFDTSGAYAMLQSSTGDTFVNAASGKTLYLRVNNSNMMTMAGSTVTLSATSFTTSVGTYINQYGANAASQVHYARASGDTQVRYYMQADGTMNFGDGASAADVSIGRSAANTLQLGAGDQLQVQQDPVAGDDLARKSYVDASGVSQLNDLSDVSQTPDTNDILYYNGTNYADITLPTLTEATTDLDDLRDVDFTPAQWDSMYHNGTNWVAIPDAFHGHYCKAYRTGTVGLANSTTTTITLQANAAGDESPTNMFTPSSTQIFVRVSGIYFILGQISYVSNATGIRICRLLTNGTQVAYSTQPAHATTSNRVQCGAWASLAAGQYIQMQGYQNSGATRNVNAGISETFLSVALMRRTGDVT